jgi:hypothetical protein
LSRLRAVLVGLLLATSVIQSVFFAWALVPDPEEEMYMYLGKLALTGRISLFQDELVGNRMPLPYYVIGLSQIFWPRSLLAARFFSAALGLACLILIWRVATRLGGELAGILALLFAATQSLLIGYFTAAYYHSLVSLLLLLALYLALCTDLPYRRLLAMAFVSLLFFTRTTMMPLIPLALVYLLWQGRDLRERALLVAIAVVPSVIFLTSDLNHWKFLAYAPFLDRIAAILGFTSNRGAAYEALYVVAGEVPVKMALLLFARRYRMWVLATVAILTMAAVCMIRGRPLRHLLANHKINVVAVTVLYLAIWQLLIMGRWKLQLGVGYFMQFAILTAICLGWWTAVVVKGLATSPRLRVAALTGLSAFFLVAPGQSRPPMLSLRVSWQDLPVTALYGLAADLAQIIPSGSRVFHLGGPLGLYLAGIDPYLRQERDVASLAPGLEHGRAVKSGFWTKEDIGRWLTKDSDYAVIVPARVASYRGTALESDLALIDCLLAEHFTRVGVLTRYPEYTYYVYRRSDEDRSRQAIGRRSNH